MVRRRTPRALRVLTLAAAAGSALLAWGPGLLGLPAADGGVLGCRVAVIPALAAALALASLLNVSLPLGRAQWQVRGIDAAGAALLLLCAGPGLWLATGMAAGLLMAGARATSGRRWRSMEYATASALLQTSVAVTVACALRFGGVGPIPSAIGGLLFGTITRHTMSAGGVALTARRPLLGLLLPRLPAELYTTGGNGAVGLLIGWLLVHAPFGVAGLVVPGLLVASTYELQARRSAEAKLFATLAVEQQRASGRSLEQSVTVLMTVAARILGGADVELLLSGPEGLVRYVGDESGVSGRSRVDPSAFDAPWVRQLLGRASVRIAADEGRPACAFSIGTGGATRAVVVARRPLGTSGFTRADAVFARALARQAYPWLTPAPEMAAAGEPRLEVVREIARRILAAPEPTSDPQWSRLLLDEVHGLERAVAALLGSAPGGMIPSPRDPGDPRDPTAPGASPETAAAQEPAGEPSRPDWTTTGRLL
jgi:hypothetical protein